MRRRNINNNNNTPSNNPQDDGNAADRPRFRVGDRIPVNLVLPENDVRAQRLTRGMELIVQIQTLRSELFNLEAELFALNISEEDMAVFEEAQWTPAGPALDNDEPAPEMALIDQNTGARCPLEVIDHRREPRFQFELPIDGQVEVIGNDGGNGAPGEDKG